MKNGIIILLLIIMTPISFGQIIYDTIPSDVVELELGKVVEEMVIFLDIDSEFDRFFNELRAPVHTDSNGGTVYASTIFSHDGTMKETRIIRSLDHFHDSITYQAIVNLSNWLPAMTRGRFVDMPFTFPIRFNEDGTYQKRFFGDIFNKGAEGYEARKVLFDKYRNELTDKKKVEKQ